MVQTANPAPVAEEVQKQAGKILGQIAGYVGTRTIQVGIREGLFSAIAKHPSGVRVESLAKKIGADPEYLSVWCRSAYAAEVLELTPDGSYRLAAHIDRLLLDINSPSYVGGIPAVLDSAEIFDSFGSRLKSGQRTWWNECSPDFIKAVSMTGRPFYARLIPAGLQKVPGLTRVLEAGASVVELASGAGRGLALMAQNYPNVRLVGVDGDEYSLKLAAEHLQNEGLANRIELVQSTLEDFDREDEFDLAFINISMHECRDIEKTTRNVFRSLKRGGTFVISDFPFPTSVADCRTVPARIMSGIQFYEAMIGDQLLPTQAFVDLLRRNRFREVGSIDVTPVHAVTYGMR